jgi:dynein heavy chain 1, cytosolic
MPLIYVDFPGKPSLTQIYGTFNKALLGGFPDLNPYAKALTNAMVDFYCESQDHFTVDMQAHYIYSPRELTRWKFAINTGLKDNQIVMPWQLVRLFVHEGLRLFEDRLVYDEEKEWCNETINNIAEKYFPGECADGQALARPMYFSSYLDDKKRYVSVEEDKLTAHIEDKLKLFQRELLDVPLVVFDVVLDHILRIDRVLK